jgi:hypothetical protein
MHSEEGSIHYVDHDTLVLSPYAVDAACFARHASSKPESTGVRDDPGVVDPANIKICYADENLKMKVYTQYKEDPQRWTLDALANKFKMTPVRINTQPSRRERPCVVDSCQGYPCIEET